MEERMELEQEIRNLQAELGSQASEIGDWKIAKCMECQTLGLEMPYNLEELHTKRQAVRDKIAEIEEKLAELDYSN